MGNGWPVGHREGAQSLDDARALTPTGALREGGGGGGGGEEEKGGGGGGGRRRGGGGSGRDF